MPFDPSLPQENTPVDAVQMRGQLNGLKDLIDAVPTITSAVVDVVNHLPPGESPVVGVSITGGVLHFSFDIPSGAEGPPGEVTLAQLADAVDNRAYTVGALDNINFTAEGEYSPTQLDEVITKINEMINRLKGN